MDAHNLTVQTERIYNCLAVASFTLATIGLISIPTAIIPIFGLIIPLASIVLGFISQVQTRKNQKLYKGQWMSLYAIILSTLLIIIPIIWNIIFFYWSWDKPVKT